MFAPLILFFLVHFLLICILGVCIHFYFIKKFLPALSNKIVADLLETNPVDISNNIKKIITNEVQSTHFQFWINNKINTFIKTEFSIISILISETFIFKIKEKLKIEIITAVQEIDLDIKKYQPTLVTILSNLINTIIYERLKKNQIKLWTLLLALGILFGTINYCVSKLIL